MQLFVFGIIILGLGVISTGFLDMRFVHTCPLQLVSLAYAQQSVNFSNILQNNYNTLTTNSNAKLIDYYYPIMKASGHFANNQIKNGSVTWIQGGLWNLDIIKKENVNDTNTSNLVADFKANFTMIKPDGSLSHNHIIDNFISKSIIFAGNDIVVTGTSDILFDNGTEYPKVPITVHLMGKKVLGLMIDVDKTKGHFSSSNEMFGTLISGIGLDKAITP